MLFIRAAQSLQYQVFTPACAQDSAVAETTAANDVGLSVDSQYGTDALVPSFQVFPVDAAVPIGHPDHGSSYDFTSPLAQVAKFEASKLL